MITTRSIPENLRVARRVLEGANGIRLIDDFMWDDSSKAWVLQAEIMAEVVASGPIPTLTEWFILADETYPWGDIGFYPSGTNGIFTTHHHQSFNDEGDSDQPWRNGKLCLDTTVRVLGRTGLNQEPLEPEDRLLWHFRRAQDWLAAASRGELVLPGEPFELPIFPGASIRSALIAFDEGPQSYQVWKNLPGRVGLVDLLQIGGKPDIFLAKRFASIHHKTVYSPVWGKALSMDSDETVQGIWMLLDSPPVQPPWQAPVTWGQMSSTLFDQNIDAFELIGHVARHIRDGHRHIALIGFPILERAEESPSQIHWQPILLPRLSTGAEYSSGFRPNETGYWHRDRHKVLADKARVDWLASENWASEEISRRGRLPEALTESKVLLLGGGAIGSALSELLVRGGVTDLVILDKDVLRAGNLTRHTLGLRDIGLMKSSALSKRLNLASPHASVVGIDADFPPSDGESLAQVLQSQIIVDCTANDEVHHQMQSFDWIEPKLFASIWMGIDARRLYCFAVYGSHFPHEILRDLVTPWLEKESGEFGNELPREGIGCWHPVFPARADDVWLMASAATKHLANIVYSRSALPQLDVFEQEVAQGEFTGLRKVASEHG